MKDYKSIEHIKNNIKPFFEASCEASYDHGYDEGYQYGLDKAWEYAERVLKLKDNERFIIFGNTNAVDIFDEYLASEAIEKIKGYIETKGCYTCGHFNDDFGCAYKCDDSLSEWTPKQIKKDCTTCKHEDEMDSSECYECVKDMQNHYEQKQDDDITIDQAIENIKRGYGIPYKHKTIALAIEALKMMKEKNQMIQAYADAERQI